MPVFGGIPGGAIALNYQWDAVTVADADAKLRSANGEILPVTLKGANAWAVSGYPISSNWTGAAGSGNGGGGPSAALLGAQCNRWECANAQKWIDQENAVQAGTPGTVDWSLADAIANVIATDPGTSGQGMVNNFHLVIGQDGYNPTYVKTQLTATPTDILTLVQWRLDQITQKYPAGTFDRMDVLNEILAATTVDIATYGWRTTAVAFYTAAHDATTLSTKLGGLAEWWFWTAFIQLHAYDASARLSWTDFTASDWTSPTDTFIGTPTNGGTNTYLYSGNNAAVFADDNSRYAPRYCWDRLIYEVWRMKLAQIPIDTVGLQSHLDYFSPIDEQALAWSMWRLNALGVAPALTESNITWFKSSGVPPQIAVGTSQKPSYQAAVYGAWYFKRYLDVILRESACKEVSGWTNDTNTQAMLMGATTYPLLSAMARSVLNAAPPAERMLKRSHRTEFRTTFLPLWVSNTGGAGSGSTLSFSGRRVAMTTSGSLQIPYSWYGHANLGKPVTASAMTMVMACFVGSGGLTSGNVLFGHGVLPSTTFTGEAFGTGDGNATVFTHTASNIPVKPGTVTITAGAITGTDDGNGTLQLIGSVRGTGVVIGSVNYDTGLMTIIYSAAPANAQAITTTYKQAGTTVPTDSAIVTAGAAQAVVCTVLVGNASKLALTLGSLQPNEVNVIAVRFDGANICGAVNGGDLKYGVATGAPTAPDTVFLGSLPDSSGTNSALGLMTFDVHSNLDYPETWQVRELSKRIAPTGQRILTLPFFAG